MGTRSTPRRRRRRWPRHRPTSGTSPRAAIRAALGGQRVLDGATNLAAQSGIPLDQLTLLDRHETYAHNDPNSAFPNNDFIDALVPFLDHVKRGVRHGLRRP